MASELKRRIIDLLKRDKEFRYTVAGLIGYEEILEELKRLREETKKGFEEHSREIRALREDTNKRFEEHDRKFNEILGRLDEHSKRFEEHDRKFNEILGRLDEHSKRFEEHDRKFNEILGRLDEHARILDEHSREIRALREDFNTFQRKLDALGARWGLMSEKAFRNGMKGIVERYFSGKVEKWIYDDREGVVFGHPAVVEVDLIVRDSEHILVEVKSSISRGDVATLLRKGELYEKAVGVKPKLAIVSPYVDDNAKGDAEKLGIEVYS